MKVLLLLLLLLLLVATAIRQLAEVDVMYCCCHW
jgi:hypothetical protein